MATKVKQEAQNPLILRSHRLMEAFAKSDDERDFYIDRVEGFMLYIDLDKSQEELDLFAKELHDNAERYCLIPKLSYYETKKTMEGFVNEKVYDIDTKEKLADIIQSKEAKENFIEFIYDHLAELEKWQQYYQERSRIRIIEWLRQNHFHFVFEEDLELPPATIEKLKHSLLDASVDKEVQNARKALTIKAKTYYSMEALNPRPKRGRPPKQVTKPDVEPQITTDIYITIPLTARPFLFVVEPTSASTFSSKFESEGAPVARANETDLSINQKLSALRGLSNRWTDESQTESFIEDEEDDDDDDDMPSKKKPGVKSAKKPPAKKSSTSKTPSKAKAAVKKAKLPKASATKTASTKPKRIMPVAKKAEKKEKKKTLKKIMPKKK